MIPGTVYALERGGELLGHLTVTGGEMFAVHCAFTPTPAFAPYRALFDEDAALTERMNDDDSPALMAEAEGVLDRILALGLVLRREGGGVYREPLIGIEGDRASFRPLNPEEEPL